ncbi:MAG: hypothetical protein LH609_11465 [Rudanella sp.]|nr:hypothetical protein [Rudanella sp.]
MDDASTLPVADIDFAWESLLNQIESLVGKRPADLNSVLFLIGIQELGRGPKRFTKEQKQDLLHIAVCRVMSLSGYYSFDGYDADGWPMWTLLKPISQSGLLEQEALIKANVIRYFDQTLTY